ncbi:HlyD family secretion protein [Oryzibacter oryziterrae]|uniref:HlyD family secretion protein n=1 Tax=Oryzibacter oryziterrae TaxID=2766474 RepID=UPI001F2D7512|nr:HlyD family secretion protein [Oryzibacter oryziterrae]
MAKRDVEAGGAGGAVLEGPAPHQPSEAPKAAAPAAPATPTPQPVRRKKSGIGRKLVLLALLGAAGYYGYRTGEAWWTEGRFMIETDDAYAAADITMVSAKASGYVTDVIVKDNQPVKAGDVIAHIDDGDYKLALVQAENALAGNVATIARIGKQVAAANAQVAQAEAGVASAKANLASAQATFDRQTSLVASKVSSQSQLDDARAARDAAAANVQSAEAAVTVAEANIAVFQAQQVEAEQTGKTLATAVDKAKRDLSFTEIRAPIDGVLGNTAFKIGTYVTPGQQLGALVALDTVHIDANFKETQIAQLVPGQKVKVTVDAFGSKSDIEGTVDSLSPATGAVFSLLPANNATGNFTKVVQRLPVRIALPKDVVESGRLRPGLSVVVAVDSRTTPAAK